jgi:hypothetical protein
MYGFLGYKLGNLLTLIVLLTALLAMAAVSEVSGDVGKTHEMGIFIPRAAWLTPLTVLLLFLGVFVSLVIVSVIRLLSRIIRRGLK